MAPLSGVAGRWRSAMRATGKPAAGHFALSCAEGSQPDILAGARQIAGQTYGYVIRALTWDIAEALGGKFEKSPSGAPFSPAMP